MDFPSLKAHISALLKSYFHMTLDVRNTWNRLGNGAELLKIILVQLSL